MFQVDRNISSFYRITLVYNDYMQKQTLLIVNKQICAQYKYLQLLETKVYDIDSAIPSL